MYNPNAVAPSSNPFGNLFDIDANSLFGMSNMQWNGLMSKIGGGFEIAGGLTSLFGVRDQWNNLNQQESLLQQQSALQMQQIDASQSLADVQSMKQANQLYGNQLAAAGTSGADLSSGSIFTATADTFINDQNRQFVTSLNANTSRLNTLYQKQAMLQQINSAKQAAGFNALGGLFSIGTGIASIL